MLKRPEDRASAALTQTSLKVLQKAGRRVSIRLEDIYWDQLQELARTDSISLNSLVFRVVEELDESTNRTSALRTYCLNRLRQELVLKSIQTGDTGLAAIITACPVPVMVLTPERRIAAYNPAFANEILSALATNQNGEKRTTLRLTFSRPFNLIVKQVVDNPRAIVAGQIGFSSNRRSVQRRVRYALADRSQGQDSYIVVFLEHSAADSSVPAQIRSGVDRKTTGKA